ncbi:MAG TPA: DNA polymerase III subunit [Rubrobacteraceae bacterium]|nr:DNA polymerase III subunit [Rubrobacteraceae bacterium]
MFSGIFGNRTALHLLEGALASGEIAHAYLFYGLPGVGKRTVALQFGAALVSGGERDAANRALRGLHPDLMEVEPEGQFTSIGQIREVMREAAGRPFEGVRRVFVLRVDTLNVQAANALLKTLEEPEGGAVFVLLAASIDGVLPTVVSRAQTVRFDPVPLEEIVSFLMDRGHQEGEARLAGALGRGSVGLALRYAEEDAFKYLRGAVFRAGFSFDGSFEDRHEAVGEIMAKAEGVGEARERVYLSAFEDADGGPDRRVKESAKRARKAARDGAVAEALELLALLYRDAALVAAGAPELVANVDRAEEIQALVAERSGADWVGAARVCGEEGDRLTYNVSPEAILEVTLSQTRRTILENSLLRNSPGS